MKVTVLGGSAADGDTGAGSLLPDWWEEIGIDLTARQAKKPFGKLALVTRPGLGVTL